MVVGLGHLNKRKMALYGKPLGMPSRSHSKYFHRVGDWRSCVLPFSPTRPVGPSLTARTNDILVSVPFPIVSVMLTHDVLRLISCRVQSGLALNLVVGSRVCICVTTYLYRLMWNGRLNVSVFSTEQHVYH